MNFPLWSLARDQMRFLSQVVKQRLRQWTRPGNHAPVLSAASDLTRSKQELILENMLLSQQLIVLQRQAKRLALTWRDRILFVLLASKLPHWKETLVIVQRLVHFGVTRNPTDAWLAQQLREATPIAQGPRYLIWDSDSKYGSSFARVAVGTGSDVLRTPYWAPKANAVCERFLGSARRECLEHFLILSEGHLHRVMREYQRYFNHARPHQGVGQRIPCQPAQRDGPSRSAQAVSHPALGGLHHGYQWRAAERRLYARAA